MLICSVCLFLVVSDRPEDNPEGEADTIINGYAVCDEHAGYAGMNGALLGFKRT